MVDADREWRDAVKEKVGSRWERQDNRHAYRRLAERVLASRHATSDEYDLASAVLDLLTTPEGDSLEATP